ncbi:MAG: pyruvate kinase [Saprospiraceae bacterium]
MEILRINCSHDQPEDWEKMITHAKKAEKVLGVKALIYMDLAGPKLRTGPVKEKKSDGKNKKRKKVLH